MKSEKVSKSNEKRLRALLMFNASPNIHLKGYTALHIATEQGAAESVKTLLDFEADPEARTEPRQETPIHLASCQGKFESFSKKIQLLVDKGADIDAQNYEWDTALHLAICRIGTADAINILLKLGASTELKGRNERTPLQYAIFLIERRSQQFFWVMAPIRTVSMEMVSRHFTLQSDPARSALSS